MVEDLSGVPPPNPESDEPISIEQRLVTLAGSLGLPETDEMTTIRESLRGHSGPGTPQLVERLGDYQDLAQALVPKNEDKSDIERIIAVNILSALAYREAGFIDNSDEWLSEAVAYAGYAGLDDLVERLTRLLQPEEKP